MFRKVRQLLRLLKISYTLARHGLDQVVVSIPLFAPLRFLPYLNPWNWSINRNKSLGVRVRQAFEELGPIFVKFGQALSTRRDILPDEVADELAKLQDRVTPFDSSVALLIVEDTFNAPIAQLFKRFNPVPLASASIAQVHAATLWDDKEVVVKILRPNVEKVIRHDIDLMYFAARLLERYWSEGPRLHPVEVVAEFEQTIFDELDFMREAANASQLRRNFDHSNLMYVPEVFWTFTRGSVVTFERIYGTPIANVEALKKKRR